MQQPQYFLTPAAAAAVETTTPGLPTQVENIL